MFSSAAHPSASPHRWLLLVAHKIEQSHAPVPHPMQEGLWTSTESNRSGGERSRLSVLKLATSPPEPKPRLLARENKGRIAEMDLEWAAESISQARRLRMCQLLGDVQRFHGMVATNMGAGESQLRCGASSTLTPELSPQIHTMNSNPSSSECSCSETGGP